MTRLVLLALCSLLFSALAAVDNPRLRVQTNHGAFVLELWPKVAPKTVANFLGLAEGSKEWTRPDGQKVRKPYFDGLIFHRVIKDFMIQGGCPLGNGSGGPGYQFEDEISAEALGLDKEMVIKAGAPWGINPLASSQIARYMQQHLDSKLRQQGEMFSSMSRPKQEEVLQRELQGMTVKELFVANGYSFAEGLASKEPLRGRIAMANAGPNTNGSQFFINLVDTPHLIGLHTVFGEVVEGIEVIDRIGEVATNPVGNRPLRDVVIEKLTVVKP